MSEKEVGQVAGEWYFLIRWMASYDTGEGEGRREAEGINLTPLHFGVGWGWQAMALGSDPTPHLILYGPPAQYGFIDEHW